MIAWILAGIFAASTITLSYFLIFPKPTNTEKLKERIRFLERRLRWDKKLSRLESELVGPRE